MKQIEIFPVGLNGNYTRFDLVGVTNGKRFFLGYTNSRSQAEVWKESILKFVNHIAG